MGQTEEGPATLHPRCGGGGDVCVGDVVGWGEGVGVRVCGGGVRLYGVGGWGVRGGGRQSPAPRLANPPTTMRTETTQHPPGMLVDGAARAVAEHVAVQKQEEDGGAGGLGTV